MTTPSSSSSSPSSSLSSSPSSSSSSSSSLPSRYKPYPRYNDSELLACDVECRLAGAEGYYLELDIPGLDELIGPESLRGRQTTGGAS